MVKLCTFWPGYVKYGLLKITSFKIKREFMNVMYNFLNKLIFKKIKSFITLKTLFKPKHFNKTPLGETGCLSNPHFLLTGCLDIQVFFHLPLPTQSVRPPLVTCPSFYSTCVTYRTPCHAIGQQVLHTQPLINQGSRGFP